MRNKLAVIILKISQVQRFTSSTSTRIENACVFVWSCRITNELTSFVLYLHDSTEVERVLHKIDALMHNDRSGGDCAECTLDVFRLELLQHALATSPTEIDTQHHRCAVHHRTPYLWSVVAPALACCIE